MKKAKPPFIAKPTGKPIDIHECYRRTMERFPKTMAVLAE